MTPFPPTLTPEGGGGEGVLRHSRFKLMSLCLDLQLRLTESVLPSFIDLVALTETTRNAEAISCAASAQRPGM